MSSGVHPAGERAQPRPATVGASEAGLLLAAEAAVAVGSQMMRQRR
jgi:hypothetical protein